MPFISVAGSFFSRKYVGEAAGLVRDLFKTARKEVIYVCTAHTYILCITIAHELGISHC